MHPALLCTPLPGAPDTVRGLVDFGDQIEYNRANDRFDNLGSTRHQGIETEVFWTPAAMPRLDLHAS